MKLHLPHVPHPVLIGAVLVGGTAGYIAYRRSQVPVDEPPPTGDGMDVKSVGALDPTYPGGQVTLSPRPMPYNLYPDFPPYPLDWLLNRDGQNNHPHVHKPPKPKPNPKPKPKPKERANSGGIDHKISRYVNDKIKKKPPKDRHKPHRTGGFGVGGHVGGPAGGKPYVRTSPIHHDVIQLDHVTADGMNHPLASSASVAPEHSRVAAVASSTARPLPGLYQDSRGNSHSAIQPNSLVGAPAVKTGVQPKSTRTHEGIVTPPSVIPRGSGLLASPTSLASVVHPSQARPPAVARVKESAKKVIPKGNPKKASSHPLPPMAGLHR